MGYCQMQYVIYELQVSIWHFANTSRCLDIMHNHCRLLTCLDVQCMWCFLISRAKWIRTQFPEFQRHVCTNLHISLRPKLVNCQGDGVIQLNWVPCNGIWPPMAPTCGHRPLHETSPSLHMNAVSKNAVGLRACRAKTYCQHLQPTIPASRIKKGVEAQDTLIKRNNLAALKASKHSGGWQCPHRRRSQLHEPCCKARVFHKTTETAIGSNDQQVNQKLKQNGSYLDLLPAS